MNIPPQRLHLGCGSYSKHTENGMKQEYNSHCVFRPTSKLQEASCVRREMSVGVCVRLTGTRGARQRAQVQVGGRRGRVALWVADGVEGGESSTSSPVGSLPPCRYFCLLASVSVHEEERLDCRLQDQDSVRVLSLLQSTQTVAESTPELLQLKL